MTDLAPAAREAWAFVRQMLDDMTAMVIEDAETELELLVGERPHGTFSRQLFLGDTLDTDAIKADYVDGVLTLRLPVAEKAKPRRVEINTGQTPPKVIDARSEERVDASA